MMMKRTKWIASGSIVVATLALALGYTLAGEELLAPAFTILGILWLVGFFRQWRMISSLALVFFVAAAGYAVLKDYSPAFMLVVVVASLSVWDLESMLSCFSRVKPGAVDVDIENRHLLRLAIVAGMGIVLGTITLLVRIQMSLVMGLLLGLVLFAALSQLIVYLRRSQA